MESTRMWLPRGPEAWVIALYPALFLLGTAASVPFWNFQAGVRCAALWTVRPKHWWIVAALEWVAWFGLQRVQGASGYTPLAVFDWMAPFLLFALAHWVVFFVLPPNAQFNSLRMVAGRLFAAIVAVAFASFTLVHLRPLVDGRDPQAFASALFESRVAAWLGMITVGLLIVTFTQRKFLSGKDFDARAVLIAFAPACILFSLMRINPGNANVDPVLIAILPLLLVSHHYGARVAVLAFNLFAACVLLAIPQLPEFWQYGRVETFLVLLGFGTVVIGAGSDLTRRRHETIAHSAVAETERSSRMSDIALRLSHQEEKDRQRIAQDLHDQLGQDLTAIATYVQIASKRTSDLGTLQYLKTVSSLVDDAHWHLRAINDKLHPIALSRFGLVRALESGPVIELLTEQGFEYDFHAQGVDRQLPEKIEIALYRICQEAITNAIKHGKHRWLSISLVQNALPDGRAQLELRIHDDEGEIDFRNSTGYGLQGIRDRAHSVGASCEFNAENGTPRFMLSVEFEPVTPQV